MNKKLLNIAKNTIDKLSLDFEGKNVFLPECFDFTEIVAVLCSMAGAHTVFVKNNYKSAIELAVKKLQEELNLPDNVVFVDKATSDILGEIDVLLFNNNFLKMDEINFSNLKHGCVISLIPEDFNFLEELNLDLNALKSNRNSVIAMDINNPYLSYYHYLADGVIRTIYKNDISVYNSKILLVGSGELYEQVLIRLKKLGCEILAARTNDKNAKEYILKHVQNVETLITIDYPSIIDPIVGQGSLISIEDIVDIEGLKILHIAGKIRENLLSFANIKYMPTNINQNGINVPYENFNKEFLINFVGFALKTSEYYLKQKEGKLKEDSLRFNYHILNKGTTSLLG